MFKKVWATTRLNLRNLGVAYLVTALVVALMLGQTVTKLVISLDGGDMSQQLETSGGNFFWLLPLLAAILVPARNYQRTISLGAKRTSFWWGALLVQALLAAAVALINTVVYYAFDLPLARSGRFDGVVNLVEVFGWADHGPLAVFGQQAAFLFLAAVLVQALTLAQGKWYGYAADVALVAIISVFTPIAGLRAALGWFFHQILFAGPWPQLAACLLLAALCHWLSRWLLARKAV
ncbi:MAG: hypothetical protein LBK42_07740 [Propionibacteriaceae bacterium]|jgi:hypothetical protein|nr:hypothetical protein [Propionibacteriaceae bacterium]